MICCPECDKPHNPDHDVQRFCRFCTTWHHMACLKGLCLPPGPGGISTLVIKHTKLARSWQYLDSFLRILCRPIQWGQNSGIVSNGQLLEMIWKVFHIIQESNQGPTKKEWEWMNVDIDSLEEWEVTGMLEKVPPQYHNCPTCRSQGKQGFL